MSGNNHIRLVCAVLASLLLLTACAPQNAATTGSAQTEAPAAAADAGKAETPTPTAAESEDNWTFPTGATELTKAANAAWYERLDFSDEREKENALRGLIEAPESVVIYREDGQVAWSVDTFGFVRENEAPDTANPSLWRHTQLNAYAGLFEVCEGIYQVRGYDMANATFIRTDNGWIIFDVMMCEEDMAAGKALMEKHFGPLDVKAVLYSHSHIDHYGGVKGAVDPADVADASLPLSEQLASGKILVLAPEGFLKHAVSENIYCGPAMGRRAQYQYGAIMEPGETGRLAIGIGLGQSVGNVGLIAPTYEICSDETIVIDGLEIQFQLTPGTEAPAEMNAFFPKYHGLWLAENCTGTMHNIYTLRGAQVRDAAAWADYILQAESRFGSETEVVFQSHNWPHWGNAAIREYMEDTAAVYQYINNQTLHYINQGMTAAEISRTLTLPDRLDKVWYCRQYYGTLSHNIKAVYQKYMGWYDANPVNLNPLTPEDTAKKWVEYLGDVDAVLKKARADFDKGEYQWVAQLTKELVYADPSNQDARDLCAAALEQLGYQSESGPWRCAYLMGAWELREGNQAVKERTVTGREGMQAEMTADMLLDYIDIMTDALAAQNDNFSLELNVTDTGERFRVVRRDGVLLVYRGESGEAADCTMSCARLQLLALMGGKSEVLDKVRLEGDATVPARLVQYMTPINRTFNIIEP
ncbi:MAG: MBL fold metallo-hydrolase [Oscillospiraceae bacterium]|nr:MBL fold metallo-hydrolase [Oscillospiraceae bacterium]